MRKSLLRLFRSFWYLITFRVDKAAEAIQKNPAVVSAGFDRVIEEKRKAIAQYRDAVASLVGQEESKRERLRVLTAEIQNLQKLRDGAVAKAKTLGLSEAEVAKCRISFKDFSAALNEKNARSDELEADIEQLAVSIDSHKATLMSMLSELDKLKAEKHDAVADILAAAEEAKAAEAIVGIANDRGTEELLELREIRNKAAAQARVSRELAGLSTKKQEAEFRQYAEQSAADDEFNMLLGIHGQDVDPAAIRINQAGDIISEEQR